MKFRLIWKMLIGFFLQTKSHLVPANAFSPPGILFAISVYASGVDVWPTTTGVTGQYIIEPVFG